MIRYFSSKTGNVQRFVDRLPFPSERVDHKRTETEPFVLITGTYSDGNGKGAVPKQVIEYLKKNHGLMIGVVASGNKSFGAYYGLAADIIARNCNKPVLHKFELSGTETDTSILTEILERHLHE